MYICNPLRRAPEGAHARAGKGKERGASMGLGSGTGGRGARVSAGAEGRGPGAGRRGAGHASAGGGPGGKAGSAAELTSFCPVSAKTSDSRFVHSFQKRKGLAQTAFPIAYIFRVVINPFYKCVISLLK